MGEILLTQKLSATNHEAQEFLYSDFHANDLYEVDEHDWRKRALEYGKKNSYWIENRNDMTRI